MYRVLWALVILLPAVILASSPVKAGDFDGLIPVLDSALVDSVALDGQVVYLDFWASWCVPCRKSFPWMADLQAKYQDQGLRVVAVNLDRDRKPAEKFLKENGSGISIVYDPEGRLARRVALDVMPTSFIFDRKGTLQQTNLGFATEETHVIEQIIQSLLKPAEAK